MTNPHLRPGEGTPAAVVELRSQVPAGVFASGTGPVRLSWRIEPAVAASVQDAYEIEVAASDDFETILAGSGVVAGADQLAVPAPGPDLASREIHFYRVRIRVAGVWSAWSPTLRVEAGLLEADDWTAEAITLPDDPGREHPSPSPVLRHQFELPAGVTKARLYVTSLGVHQLTLNGKPVAEAYLAPGWTAYRKRLLADTYDVTGLLRRGDNVLLAALGDGWFRGRLGWNPGHDRCHYGKDLGLIAQLEVELEDGSTQRIVSDRSWLATTAEIRLADIYDGSVIDLSETRRGAELPGHDTSGWLPAAVVPFEREHIEPRVAEPVRAVTTIPVRAFPPMVDGVLHLDAGQNIAGFLRLRVQGRAGDTITVRHAEVLEPDGSLHTRSLRSARATDVYTLADTRATMLEPAFTFHGFRYAEVSTEATVLEATFVAISSDTPRRGWFECSDRRLSRFHDNVLWSQRDNFVSVPTDCPQRDERLGWTGDAQAFAPTACTLFAAEAFWCSWLIDLAHDQDDELGVPSVVPDVVLAGESEFGRAGWADAATMVPWAVYESFGDPAVLRQQLESMVRWLESLQARRGEDGLLPESMQFGDWLDPDAPSDRPWESKADSRFLANAFLVHSARLLARVGAVLDRDDLRVTYDGLADEVAGLTWATWAEHALENQTAAAVALCFELMPAAEREAVAATLARLVRAADGRVATGFLGTPLVLPALAAAGYYDEAYLMLLRDEAPSWLYQVSQGATTVWERWDAIRPDGSIHDGRMQTPPEMPDTKPEGEGHMLSFNHYAYGAVIDWVYRHLAGLAPDPEQPGYRHVRLAPHPARGIEWARAAVETSFGRVSTEWQLDEGQLLAEIELPFGTSGTFIAPAGVGSVVRVDGAAAETPVRLGPGRHTVSVTAPLVAAPHGVVTA